MRNIFYIVPIILGMISCKSREEVNNTLYTTPPEIGRLITDVPKRNGTHIKPEVYTELPAIPKQNSDTDLESLTYKHDDTLKQEDTVSHQITEPAEVPQKESTQNNENTTEEPDSSTNIPVADSKAIKTVESQAFSDKIGELITQIVDLRTSKEFSEGHIYDAVNIDLLDPKFMRNISRLDKNRPVAVYCQTGKRSLYAAQILDKSGFKIIYNLEGGLTQWEKDGKEIIQ